MFEQVYLWSVLLIIDFEHVSIHWESKLKKATAAAITTKNLHLKIPCAV